MTDAEASRRPTPDFVFETSWEVANMVGGIHTVLASKARTMRERFDDDYICIGPKLFSNHAGNREFESAELFPGLNATLQPLGLSVVTGRWKVPGEPQCILVDFSEVYKRKDEILEWLWLHFKVDSLTGGWDYIEPVLFGHAAGHVIDTITKGYLIPGKRNIVSQWHEWMVGAGLLHLKLEAPEIASVFTTHATVLGRAVCSTGASIDEAITDETPAEAAARFGVAAKHSIESTLARESDCFTTVSEITARECVTFFGREPELLPNGIGDDYPPSRFRKPEAVNDARQKVFELAELMTGRDLDREATAILLTAGRYEYMNKGLDLVVDAWAQLRNVLREEGRRVVAIITYPTATTGPDRELLKAKQEGARSAQPRVTTHTLQEAATDPLLNHLRDAGFHNHADDPVTLLNIPIYLDGSDALVPIPFYAMVAAADLTQYPSAYEPWGYTPLESLAYGVPTVTSDLAGFGRWVDEQDDIEPEACLVLQREDRPFEESREGLAAHIHRFLTLDDEARERARKGARGVAQRAHWSKFAVHYFEAFSTALGQRRKRMPGATSSMTSMHLRDTVRIHRKAVSPDGAESGPRMHLFTVRAKLPEELIGLRDLAYNLWWTWNPRAAGLFRNLSPRLWREVCHNPLRLLETLSQAAIERSLNSPEFLQRMKDVLGEFRAYMDDRPRRDTHDVAYFCMEYGLHESMPFYSGGLGVLAGDTLKSASDLKLSFCAVGLAYRRGSFKQTLNRDGEQREEFNPIDFTNLPMKPVMDEDGERLTVYVRFPGRAVAVQGWRVEVGSVPLLLLDTDHPNNSHADREITSILYAGDRERRLQQEIVLGIGGAKFLRALGTSPRVFHMNESHTALLSIDRQLSVMRDHDVDYPVAFEFCRRSTVFTTHTPIPAGHESFKEDLLRPYLVHFQDRLHRKWEDLMAMGRMGNEDTKSDLSMSLVAIRNAGAINAVSKVHRRVSQHMFARLMPAFHEAEVPIGSVTNGAHRGTWIGKPWQEKFEEMFGPEWRLPGFDESRWDEIRDIPDPEFSEIRRKLRRRLLDELTQREREAARTRGEPAATVSRILENLRDDAMIVGFARRFVPYKRPTLLFKDLDSLKRILTNEDRPVLFLFAGKAHPQDVEGKRLIREIFQLSRHDEFAGRLLFLEGYDLALARLLVRGCDVWLNNPTRPLEASGTSGMKAAMNGCVNLSVLDGWWAEGWRGNNGWAIESVSWYDGVEIRHDPRILDQDLYTDEADCERIHWLLRHEIIPRFFGEEPGGTRWADVAREAMISALRDFSSLRMMREYHDGYYAAAMEQADALSRDGFRGAREAVARDERVRDAWPNVRILDCDVGKLAEGPILVGHRIEMTVRLNHPGLAAEELSVELVTTRTEGQGHELDPIASPLKCVDKTGEGESAWKGEYRPRRIGQRAYGVRVLPRGAEGPQGIDLARALVHWA